MVRTAAFSFALAAATISSACIGLSSNGVLVRFNGQRNIVVWDAAHQTEHFVRDARFEVKGQSLGFIAPTPTRPTIESVSDQAFSQLEEFNPRKSIGNPRGGPGFGGGGLSGGAGVSVVETRFIAGYTATVLHASDPRALTQWLKSNDYETPRFAAQWAAPYVARGWYFTAFKVTAQDGNGATGPVRMTFQTTLPYNAYSVPAENSGKNGLQLYYVSAGNEEPKIGGVQPWASPKWIAPMPEKDIATLATNLKVAASSIPTNSLVRFYRDTSFGRPGFDDIYFVPGPKPPVGPGISVPGTNVSGTGAAGVGDLSALMCLGIFGFAQADRRRS